MKKTIVCAALFCMICLFAGCGDQQESESGDTMYLNIPDANKIVVYSASGDKKEEVTDMDMVQVITNSFLSVAFEKDKASNNLNGVGFMIQWYDNNDDLVFSLSALGTHEIDYGGYYWKAIDGSINMEMLNELWETENSSESFSE